VERDDRSPVAPAASFFVDGGNFSPGSDATLGEQAAHHARVKRLAMGDAVRLTDGMGHRASGIIHDIRRAAIVVGVHDVEKVERPAPIHLCAPVADRDRMLWLAEKAAELGITTWQSVRFRRSMSVSPRGEGEAFANKIRARMVSALEQSGGAWLPEVLPDATLDSVATLEFSGNEASAHIVLDASGAPMRSIVDEIAIGLPPTILVGPEGGMETDETAALRASGWRSASIGQTTLRFETAGIAAIAIVRAAYSVR
jgi:16S rRNA (uracil1498-N3)-methyltransferase